jgi:hypothetical protein
MQNHIVVGRILVVPVLKPVRRFLMYLYISGPGSFADADFCIEKIGPRIRIWLSVRNNFNRPAIGSFQVGFVEKPVFPYKLEKFFLHIIGYSS